MLANAKHEAELLRNQASEDLKAVLARREKAALEKIAQAETQAIQDALRRLALAEPSTGLTLRDATGGGEGRQLLSLPALLGDEDKARRQRIRDLVGKPFLENAIQIDTSREEIHLSGYAGLPTYSRGAAVMQFLFVNGRPVKDR
ncbi:MAG: hypothetical protein AAGD92_17145, partial [Pseudomonadota bacterium]